MLESGARRLGLSLSPEQLEKFRIYYRELIAWNEKVNLTAIVDPEGVQVKHFLDSLTCALVINRHLEGAPPALQSPFRLIDVGSGAGLPGVPLKIYYPDMHLTLLDSVGKKTAFLAHLAEMLDFHNIEVITGRAEDLARDPEHRESYDVAVARAVAAMPVLAEYCLPFVRTGGLFIAQKGEVREELAAAEAAIRILGGGSFRTEELSIPPLLQLRTLVIVDKVKHTLPAYPRRAGLPTRSPLGSPEPAPKKKAKR